jgi:hypothetical protein
LAIFGDQVDASPAGPFIPEPDSAKFVFVDRVVGQEPLADVLELLALDAVVGIELVEQVSECPHTRGC